VNPENRSNGMTVLFRPRIVPVHGHFYGT
jgi:hypothetical protein